MNLNVALTGYMAAALAYGVLIVVLATVWRTRVRGSRLLIVCVFGMLWALATMFSFAIPDVRVSQIYLIETVHDTVWLIFLASLLGGSVTVESNRLVRRGGVAAGLVLTALAVLLEFGGWYRQFPSAASQLLVIGSVCTSLFALVGVEQLYRNARPSQQSGLKFMCLAIAAIFTFDLIMYSKAVVDGTIPVNLWSARGYVVAMCVPLFAVSVRRVST